MHRKVGCPTKAMLHREYDQEGHGPKEDTPQKGKAQEGTCHRMQEPPEEETPRNGSCHRELREWIMERMVNGENGEY